MTAAGWFVISLLETMKLQAPALNIYARYTKLKTMAERGTVHEAIEARVKLAALEKKYTFDKPPPEEPNEDDLFARASKIKPDDRNHHVVRTFSVEDSEIAAFAKWALFNAFKIEGVWKFGKGSKTDLCVGAKKTDLPYLKHVVGVIVESFQRLWEQFRSSKGASPGDENVFYRGLYDGLMRDPRKAGEAIPKPPPPKKRAKQRKGAAPVAAAKSADSCVHLHAYEIACSLGEQIRLSHPLDNMIKSLDDLLRIAGRSEASPT